MSIALFFSFHILLFINPLLIVLFVTTGVGGFRWTISSRAVLREPPHLKLTNNAPISDSIALASILFIVVYSTCMVPLSGGDFWGGFLWI